MRILSGLITLLALVQPLGAALADDPAACFNAKCQDKAQSCLSDAFGAQNACEKSARTGCDKVMLAQKFACLSGALNLCSTTHSTAEASCIDTVHSCSATCGPREGKIVNYWCTAMTDGGPKSGFCPGTPGKRAAEQWDLCVKQLFSSGATEFGLVDCQAL